MRPGQTTAQTIDEYVAGFPENVQNILQRIRMSIRKAAPDAEEAISYGMPTFNLNGHYLIYFAAYKKHIGLYPVPTGDAEFSKEISTYQSGKGTLQFALDKPIPYRLITRVVKLRAKENLRRAEAKEKKK
jgi:uncharacterized protein YdhG (YjbR/CyaY superfamily)